MGNLKTKELDNIGYTDDRLKSIAINTVAKHFKHQRKADTLALLAAVKNNPVAYVGNNSLQKIAEALLIVVAEPAETFELKQQASLRIYGEGDIEEVAKKQMRLALLRGVSFFAPEVDAGSFHSNEFCGGSHFCFDFRGNLRTIACSLSPFLKSGSHSGPQASQIRPPNASAAVGGRNLLYGFRRPVRH